MAVFNDILQSLVCKLTGKIIDIMCSLKGTIKSVK